MSCYGLAGKWPEPELLKEVAAVVVLKLKKTQALGLDAASHHASKGTWRIPELDARTWVVIRHHTLNYSK
jgi:hypothetical protein